MAIWADATFVWNPGGSSTASFDELTMTDAAGITEGTFVSTPRNGRTYSGAVASRFNGLVAAADPNTSGMTLMSAVRSPVNGNLVYGISVQQVAAASDYAVGAWVNNSAVSGSYRRGGATPGGAAFPVAQATQTFDNNIHVVIVRYTVSATFMVVDLFIDGILYASDLETHGGDINMDQITVGRLERATPANSSGGGVYAAATWDRPLTNAEVRAISSNPYSYPTDPTDPDDWEEGAAGTEWENVAFYWDPNHAGDRGINRLYGGAVSDGTLTEGSEVTVSSVDGRQYNGAQGSRFDIVLLNLTDRFALAPPTCTIMAVVARPGVGSLGGAFFAGFLDDQDVYMLISWDDTAEAWLANARANGGTPSGNNWLQGSLAVADANTDLHVVVARMTEGGGSGSLAQFLDALGTMDTDAQTFSPAAGDFMNRVTVGRADDNTPSNATNIQVFAAAYWPRALSDDEITAVLADPYGFPGAAPVPPTPAASNAGRIRSPRYGLTRLARR